MAGTKSCRTDMPFWRLDLPKAKRSIFLLPGSRNEARSCPLPHVCPIRPGPQHRWMARRFHLRSLNAWPALSTVVQ